MNQFRDFGERGLHSGLSTLGDFRKFILRGNVVDLAVGIVIGAAFTAVVNAVVADLITPLIGLFGIPNFSNWSVTVGGPGHQNVFKYGAVINAIISFLIVSAVVYFLVVKPVNKLTDRFTPHKDTTPTTRDCPFCLSTVPLRATRCAYCTAQLPPADTTTTGTRA